MSGEWLLSWERLVPSGWPETQVSSSLLVTEFKLATDLFQPGQPQPMTVLELHPICLSHRENRNRIEPRGLATSKAVPTSSASGFSVIEDVVTEEKPKRGACSGFSFLLFPEGVPKSQLLPLLLLSLCENYSSSSVMSYSGFMVLDFIKGTTPESAGYYAGILTSAYFLCQFMSSPVLGWLSDRIGRKPILVLGTAGNCLSQLAIGFSVNFPMAVAGRCLNGILNGNISTIKATAADISDASNRNQVFSKILLFSGLGSVLGGMTGGLLARPAAQYPNVFPQHGLFVIFPYLLPNAVCALILLIALCLSARYLQSPKARRHRLPSSKSPAPSSSSPADPGLNETPHGVPIARRGWCSSIGLLLKPGNRVAFAACALYAIFGLAMTCFRAIIPVWAIASTAAGGLHFSAAAAGIMFSIAGALVIPIQMFLYPLIVRRLKLLWCFRLGCVIACATFCCAPLLSKLCVITGHNALFWAALVFMCFCWMGGTQNGFAAINTLVANSVTSELVGTVNGLGQGLVALMRSFGPASFSPLLAWSMSNGRSFPLNVFFPFFIISIAPLFTAICSLFLPKSLNLPREEEEEERSDVSEDTIPEAEPSIEVLTSTTTPSTDHPRAIELEQVASAEAEQKQPLNPR